MYITFLNLNTNEIKTFDEFDDNSLYNYFSIGNKFILIGDKKTYAFDDITGKQLWSQIYLHDKRYKVIIKDDHFIITEEDGCKYKITSDGIKIREGESLGNPPILPKPTVIIE